jgi:uncharacterized protein
VTPDTRPSEVRDNPERGRFEVQVGDAVAYAEYRQVGNALLFSHTEVPEGLEGQGVGSRLIRGALEATKARGLGVIPICPFVAGYIREHPEYRELVNPVQRRALGI